MFTKEEILTKENYVDGNYGWHFAKGKEVLQKAKRLIKNGYSLADYTNDEVKEVEISRIERYTGVSAGVPFGVTGYDEICEYVDRKNKVYYFRFSGKRNENLGC